MYKVYFKDWQENAGYEEYQENKPNKVQRKNLKVVKSEAGKASKPEYAISSSQMMNR